jgi:hypothetical protein
MSFHPQTPQSPSRFSPATSSSDPSVSLATSMASSMTTLPTPAHSVNGSSTSQPDVAMADDSPHKRKRPLDDSGGREQKKVHLEDRKLGIADLHQDVGHKYLLCQTRKTPFYCSLSRLVALCQGGIPTVTGLGLGAL